jgi:hypothetical protein
MTAFYAGILNFACISHCQQQIGVNDTAFKTNLTLNNLHNFHDSTCMCRKQGYSHIDISELNPRATRFWIQTLLLGLATITLNTRNNFIFFRRLTCSRALDLWV